MVNMSLLIRLLVTFKAKCIYVVMNSIILAGLGFFVGLSSCTTEINKGSFQRLTDHVSPVLQHEKNDHIDSNALNAAKGLNFTDTNGLKQGVWEVRGWKNRLLSRVFYVNDIPHGPYILNDNYYKVGTYNHGKKQGVERWTYTLDIPDNDLVVLYFEDDSMLWQAHPMADAGQLIPVKGIRTFTDSVLVNVPFYNGQTWYRGLYIKDKPKGIHKIYYPNGALQGWVNYELFQAETYDSLGHVLTQDSVRWGGNNYLIVPKNFRKR